MREYTPEEVAIFPSLDSVQTSNFVIVRCLKSDADPFMVAEVISNNYETNRL